MDPGTLSLLGSLASSAFGAFRKRRKRRSTFDDRQQRLYDMLDEALYGRGPQADLYNVNPEEWKDYFERNVRQPAMESFQKETVPTITGQFRGGNLMNSTYAGEALAGAGAKLQKGLDAQLADILFKAKQASLERRSRAISDQLGRNTFDYEDTENPWMTAAQEGAKFAGGYYGRGYNRPAYGGYGR